MHPKALLPVILFAQSSVAAPAQSDSEAQSGLEAQSGIKARYAGDTPPPKTYDSPKPAPGTYNCCVRMYTLSLLLAINETNNNNNES